MSEPEEMTLEKALNAFKHRDEFKFIIDLIREEREGAIKGFTACKNEFEAGKIAGRIDGVDWVIDILTHTE